METIKNSDSFFQPCDINYSAAAVKAEIKRKGYFKIYLRDKYNKDLYYKGVLTDRVHNEFSFILILCHSYIIEISFKEIKDYPRLLPQRQY